MATIRAGRYRFHEGAVSRRDPLLSTDSILHSLSGGQKIASSGSENRSTDFALSQEQKSVLETCLAGYIGPMAGIICEDHLDVVADLQTAIDALVAELPSPEQAEKFRVMVLEKLG